MILVASILRRQIILSILEIEACLAYAALLSNCKVKRKAVVFLMAYNSVLRSWQMQPSHKTKFMKTALKLI